MGAGIEKIREKIRSFKKRYYLNIFIRGLILSLSIVFSYVLLAALVEHNLWLSPWARFIIFLSFFIVIVYCFFRFLKEPLKWWMARRGLSEQQSAQVIGRLLPDSQDRLLNLVQLASNPNESQLTQASIKQKSEELEPISFESLIDINQNRRYLKFLVLPFLILMAILVINSQILTKSTDRIFHFNRHYSPEAPFHFSIDPKSLTSFYNEDFVLKVKLDGQALPQEAYILTKNQRLKLIKGAGSDFSYVFENIQEGFDLQLEAAGFFSDIYKVTLINRPELINFSLTLEYPRYLKRSNQKLINTGNLEIPEGTNVIWSLGTFNTTKTQIHFASTSTPFDFQESGDQVFSYARKFKEQDRYEILLENNGIKNREQIAYSINVIKDQFPTISVSNFKDSVLYQRVILGGSIGDDYGVTQLTLFYKIRDINQREVLSKKIQIPIRTDQAQQSFFYNWSLDSVKLEPGNQLEYHLQVWDNDAVNGCKSTKTALYTFQVPTKQNLVTEIKSSQSKTESKIEQGTNKADKLQEQIDEASKKLKGKTSLDWQDKKMLENIIQQKNALDQMVEQLREENKLLDQKKEAFTEQDERIKEKAEQIQKLMDELLDEETKKLFEELQKLLKENTDVSQIQKLLDKLNQNTNNLEKELERTLELFKQLQFDYKVDQAIQGLKDQKEKQQSLLNDTEALEKKGSKSNKQSDKDSAESKELAEQQQKLEEEISDLKEQLKDIEKLGDELEKKNDLPSEESIDEIQRDQKNSQEQLQQNQPAKSKPSQQKAIQKMQNMQDQLESSQNSMSMEVDMQNLETLRQIIHGLVKLSFDQEGILKSFGELNQNDPRFNSLAQQQIKLKDDAKVLEDSLLALGKRDPFMGSIITKEISELNSHLDNVINANKERRRPQASGEMQMSMTGINNLALMLDDHFDMMMQMMANAQPSMGKGKGKKPSLSEMQQQLNQKIQELKGSGKTGRQLSEELAEMAAEQERIRKALEEMQNKLGDNGKMPGGDLPGKMEQTEMDLVNKQITDQLIKRQQEILTRLLQAEKSAREQDMDEERKGETAKDYNKEIPKAFEEYLRLKEKEVELLKTVPPKLYPYYKKEVGEYFKRMNNQ
ncbi:MAG TPA: hypothetical protein VGK59_01320 [Ohtaekwangia sp.]